MQTACDAINQCAAELDIHIEPISGPYYQPFDEQINILLEEKVPIVSFTFGLLDQTIIKQFKKNNVILIGTATTAAEAQTLEENAVDAIIIQGEEAGGHRGSFLNAAEKSSHPLNDLLEQTKKVTSLPLIAAGGIMNGQRIAELITAGASAAQLGTAFLCCNESGIPSPYRQALIHQTKGTTVLTKAFSGKLARGISNSFIRCMEKQASSILDYPIQNKLTGTMRKQAKAIGNTNYMSLWAGQSVHLSRQLDAKNLIELLVDEASNA
jgi:nitronate monooxygenase